MTVEETRWARSCHLRRRAHLFWEAENLSAIMVSRSRAQIQDSLLSVLSDKVLNVPELGMEGLLFARQGFNVIGTANTRDKGVNEMSSAETNASWRDDAR